MYYPMERPAVRKVKIFFPFDRPDALLLNKILGRTSSKIFSKSLVIFGKSLEISSEKQSFQNGDLWKNGNAHLWKNGSNADLWKNGNVGSNNDSVLSEICTPYPSRICVAVFPIFAFHFFHRSASRSLKNLRSQRTMSPSDQQSFSDAGRSKGKNFYK